MDFDAVGRVGGKLLGRERPKVKAFLFELGLTASVESIDDLLDKLFVVDDRAEVSAASDHQGLVQRRLQTTMRLLDDSVLVGTTRMDPCRAKAVVLDQLREALGERSPSAALQLMSRSREVVAADHLRRSA